MRHYPGQNATQSFLSTIHAFKAYLISVKETSGYFLDISASSKELLSQWDTAFHPSPDLNEFLFFSEGPEKADVYIVDSQTRFYKGESGALLVKILAAMGLDKNHVFICNSDDPPALKKKITTHHPKVMITFGSKAGKTIKQTDQPLDGFRGHFFEYHGVKVMPTYHPSLLIKDPQYKRPVWDDMQQVMALVGLSRNA